jgi:DNA-binding transcriptional LysR family regulator
MRMLFEELKALVAVIEQSSLTRAADSLCLTQSAVSRRIQQLEETLGAVLLDRGSRPPVATALGHRVYEQSLPLLRGAAALLDLPKESALPSGRFRVGFTQMVADAVMFEVVMAMKGSYPDLEVQLLTGWSSTLQQQILQGQLDAASLTLASPSQLPGSLQGEFITTLDIVVVQSRNAPLTTDTCDINSLSSLEWILNPHGCGYRVALEAAMGAKGQKLRLGVDTHGTSMQLRMVSAGLGLGLVPRGILEKSQWVDQLSVIEVSDFALKLDLWIVHPLQPGNLRQANERLAQTVDQGFAAVQ